MRRQFAHVSVGGTPVTWLGANFWSRRGGPLMWRDYDGPTVSAELAVLQRHGVDVTRSFLYWPDFHPAPDVVDEVLLERFRDFLDRHHDLGMTSIPTFLVGHMSGQNWDPPWRSGRDLYADVWLVARQAWFAGQVVKRLTAHPAVAGWLLSNEMPIYGRPPQARPSHGGPSHGGPPQARPSLMGRLPRGDTHNDAQREPHGDPYVAPAEQVTAWAQLLIDAVRAAGGHQPVSVGDGAWGPEITGVDNGFALRELAPLVDFLGPHVYPMGNDVVRQHLAAAFVCELAGFAGRPVVLEEFGVTTDFASAENAGHYYRQTLHSTLLAGATGWLAWNNTDFDDLADQAPYTHHPFEMHFGITDSSGAAKPPLLELRDFRAVLDDIEVLRCRRPDTAAALLLTSYAEVAYPFTEAEDRTAPLDALRQAYVAAHEADLPVTVEREVDGLPDDAALIIVPSVKQLTALTWRRLAQLAEDGATVYVSYFAGTHGVQRGPWYADLNGMFGVRHHLRYGLADPIVSETVTITFVADFGGIPSSSRLTFAVGGSTDARSFLPVTAAEATVLAVDDTGRPALLVRDIGAGRIVLATYPFEYLASAVPAVNPEPTYRLYDALAQAAGIRRDVVVDDPRVHVGELTHEDGRRFVWLISQAEEALTVKPQVGDGLALCARDSGQRIAAVDLAPYGVSVLRLRASARSTADESGGGPMT